MKSISERTDLTEEGKEELRRKVKALREYLLEQDTSKMTLEERVLRLERFIAGE